MTRAAQARDESGMSLVEVMISMVLFVVVIVTVDASITVVQSHQVQVSDRTQALDYLQDAQQAITEDLHAAVPTSWTSPVVPTSAPGSPITSTSLAFSAQLGGGTPTISIALNTSTHVLTVTCTGAGCRPTGTTAITQAKISNVDSSSLFTMTTKEVSTTANSATTNAFFFTAVTSSLILDTPKVGAQNVFKSTLSDPNIVVNNGEYACQSALSATGATGSC
jgi:Tfp pilus assembly protein PilV